MDLVSYEIKLTIFYCAEWQNLNVFALLCRN